MVTRCRYGIESERHDGNRLFSRMDHRVYSDAMNLSFVRPNIRSMQGYTPGEQPGVGERVVKLNTNENPFPPSPRVMQAIRDIEPEQLRRYPNPTADVFREAAARLWNITPDMILAGNGSDDILTIATRTFVPPGGALAYPDPTYSLYSVLARIEDARTITLSWEKNWDLPVDALLRSGANAIYVANPNAPSGTFVSPARISELIEKFDGLVLIDEAYADFAEDNCVSLASKYDNVVVSRSFSKAYSLAGLRFGYAIANPTIIQQMMKVKDSYNCDAISIAAATAALLDQDHARMTWTHVKQERERLSSELTEIGFEVLPSQANFLFAKVPDGDGTGMYKALKALGILVRHFDRPGLKEYLRITIGTSQENNALLSGIRELLGKKQVA
ncbi:MAG: histidinol-phosphate aminotransferase [Phycisphaerae bacterium]|nr:MAG: histidinol-phosphate aminotransferase [Phycisphaerae bacterium]